MMSSIIDMYIFWIHMVWKASLNFKQVEKRIRVILYTVIYCIYNQRVFQESSWGHQGEWASYSYLLSLCMY